MIEGRTLNEIVNSLPQQTRSAVLVTLWFIMSHGPRSRTYIACAGPIIRPLSAIKPDLPPSPNHLLIMGPSHLDISRARTSKKVHDNSSPTLPAFRELFCGLVVISLVIYKCFGFPLPRFWLAGPPSSGLIGSLPPDTNSTTCPQWAALHPTKYQELSQDLDTAYNSEDFKQTAIQALADLIRVP